MKKIVLAGFQHETNTFAASTADMRAFELGGGWPGICHGENIQPSLEGANIPAAGFFDAATGHDVNIVCATWAAASPSAHVEQEVYENIAGQIISGIAQALPADGVYLDLHGAMVAQHIDDGEGELIRRVRELVGADVAIVASLDLHANVTEQMLDAATAMVAYRTYPHVDMADTGKRAFELLWNCMANGKLALAYQRLPFLIPTCWQSTMMEPAKSIYADFDVMEKDRSAISLSFAMGFPAADFSECTPVVWAYAQDAERAEAIVKDMNNRILGVAEQFAGRLYQPDEAVSYAIQHSKDASLPIVIADAQDNPGAGANSDTTGVLRELLHQNARASMGLIVDEASARAAHEAGVGNSVTLSLGGKSNVEGDAPLEATFVVESLSDGRFDATGDYYGGCQMNLGPSACLRINDVRVVVSSYKAQMADLAMFRYVGIEPTKEDILVVKSTAHFRADFDPIAHEILVCTAPGDMSMRTTELPWTSLPDDLLMYPGGPSFAEWKKNEPCLDMRVS